MNLIILSSMYPNSKIYMSGIFVHEQVKELVKLGINITVFAPIPYSPWPLPLLSNKWKKFREVPKFEIIDGIKIYHTRYLAVPGGILKNYWSFLLIIPIIRILKKLKKDSSFDLIHAHGSLPDDFAANLISKKMNIPYFITVHGETVYMKKIASHLKRSIEAINSADKIIGVSKNVVQRIKRITGRKDGIYKIFNGFNAVEIEKNKINRQMDVITILFGATLVERKGCEYLIRAFNKLTKEFRGIQLIIAGGGELLVNLKKMSEDLGLGSQVEFLGAISHDKMLEEMAACDIFCLPSWDEAFGVVYLEAMSFKKPVIGTYDEGISEIVKDGENGFLVKPKNSEDIYDKIKILLSDPQKRLEVGEKGYETIKNITWEKNAREMYNLYDEIINK